MKLRGWWQGAATSQMQCWDVEGLPVGADGAKQSQTGTQHVSGSGRHQRPGGDSVGPVSATLAPATQTRKGWTQWSCIHWSQTRDKRGLQGLRLLPEPSILFQTGWHSPRTQLGWECWGASCCGVTPWDPQSSSMRRSWESSGKTAGKTARKTAGKGSALLPAGPWRRLQCQGVGGQLVLLLALDNCALWDSIFWDGAAAGAGVGAVGAVGGSSSVGATGFCLLGFAWRFRVPPGVTDLGIHGLGQSFSHRHRELPLLHPKGNQIF